MRCRDVRMFVYFLYTEVCKRVVRTFYSSTQYKKGTRFLTYYDEGKEYIMLMEEVLPRRPVPFISAEIKTEKGFSLDVTETLKKLLGINNNFFNKRLTLNDIMNIENIKSSPSDFYFIEITDNNLEKCQFNQFDILCC